MGNKAAGDGGVEGEGLTRIVRPGGDSLGELGGAGRMKVCDAGEHVAATNSNLNDSGGPGWTRVVNVT